MTCDCTRWLGRGVTSEKTLAQVRTNWAKFFLVVQLAAFLHSHVTGIVLLFSSRLLPTWMHLKVLCMFGSACL